MAPSGTSGIVCRRIEKSSDRALVEAFALYTTRIDAADRASEDHIKDWIDHSEERFRRPLFYVVAERDKRVIGIVHYTYVEALSHAFISYIAVKPGTDAFAVLVSYLRRHLRELGCAGAVCEVDRLEPGWSDKKFEERRRRLLIFQKHGAKVLRGVPYLQPDTHQRTARKHLHLMYVPFDGRETVPSREVRRLIKFVYMHWYGDPYGRGRRSKFYLWRLSLRRFVIPLYEVPLVKPISQDVTRLPRRWWRDLLLPSSAVATGVLYSVGPARTVLDTWIADVFTRVGSGTGIVLLAIMLTGAQLAMMRDRHL